MGVKLYSSFIEENRMPRQARLDAPGTLHHVIIRGIEKGDIVEDDGDIPDADVASDLRKKENCLK